MLISTELPLNISIRVQAALPARRNSASYPPHPVQISSQLKPKESPKVPVEGLVKFVGTGSVLGVSVSQLPPVVNMSMLLINDQSENCSTSLSAPQKDLTLSA